MKHTLYIVMDLEWISSCPEVDEAFILVNAGRQEFNCRFDSLEFERENGYRHPPCVL